MLQMSSDQNLTFANFLDTHTSSAFVTKGDLDVPYRNINRICFYHWLHTLEPTQRTVHARQTLIPLQRLCGFLPSREQIADGVKETSFFVGEEAAGVEGGGGRKLV